MDGSGGSGGAHEIELLAFADEAIVPAADPTGARKALQATIGTHAAIDAAAVIAGFDAITRVADGSGIPLEPPKAEASAEWRARLGIDDYWKMKV
jgi:hypothetical protein